MASYSLLSTGTDRSLSVVTIVDYSNFLNCYRSNSYRELLRSDFIQLVLIVSTDGVLVVALTLHVVKRYCCSFTSRTFFR